MIATYAVTVCKRGKIRNVVVSATSYKAAAGIARTEQGGQVLGVVMLGSKEQ